MVNKTELSGLRKHIGKVYASFGEDLKAKGKDCRVGVKWVKHNGMWLVRISSE